MISQLPVPTPSARLVERTCAIFFAQRMFLPKPTTMRNRQWGLCTNAAES